MTEMINNAAEIMTKKMRIINRVRKEGSYKSNMRKCPFYSEFVGMCQLMKAMEIEYEIEWNQEDNDLMTAIVIMGKRLEV